MPVPVDVDRLLLVCPSWIGDTIMATPLLRHARRACPRACITAVMRPSLRGVLEGLDSIDERCELDMRGGLGPWRAGWTMRAMRPDAIVLMPNSFRAAVAARCSGSPIRVGFRRDGRGLLLTDAVEGPSRDHPVPAVEVYRRLAEAAFGGDASGCRPELVVTDAQHAEAAAILGETPGEHLVLVPGATRPDKRWPATRFAAVADALAESHGLQPVVTGAPGEGAVVDEVVAACRTPALDLVRRGVTPGALKGVIARARLVVTNDTGPRHIALATGTPVVSLFGPTDHRWTRLESARERVLLAQPFLPEESIADRHCQHCRIDRIEMGDVLGAAEALLAEDGSGGSDTMTPPTDEDGGSSDHA